MIPGHFFSVLPLESDTCYIIKTFESIKEYAYLVTEKTPKNQYFVVKKSRNVEPLFDKFIYSKNHQMTYGGLSACSAICCEMAMNLLYNMNVMSKEMIEKCLDQK